MEKIINLSEKNSLFNQFLSEIRNREIQKDLQIHYPGILFTGTDDLTAG